MAEPKTQETPKEQETAIATVGGAQGLQGFDGFGGFDDPTLQALASEMEDTLKAMSITEFQGARGLLDIPVSLLDAFPFTMTEQSKSNPNETLDVLKVLFVVADQATGEVYNVMQNHNSSRQRFIDLYSQAKALNIAGKSNRRLTLTNLVFREVGQAKYGNRPIVLTFTPETDKVFN